MQAQWGILRAVGLTLHLSQFAGTLAWVNERPPFDKFEFINLAGLGLFCVVLAARFLFSAVDPTRVGRVLTFALVFVVAGVGAYHLGLAVEALERPVHRDMPTSELAFGFVVGLVTAAVYWARTSNRLGDPS